MTDNPTASLNQIAERASAWQDEPDVSPIDLKLIEEYSKVLIQAAVVTSEAAEIVRRIAPIISTKLRVLAEADPRNETCVLLDIAWRSLYRIGGPLNEVSTAPVVVLTEHRKDAVKLAVSVQRLFNTQAGVADDDPRTNES